MYTWDNHIVLKRWWDYNKPIVIYNPGLISWPPFQRISCQVFCQQNVSENRFNSFHKYRVTLRVIPADKYLLLVNIKDTRKMSEGVPGFSTITFEHVRVQGVSSSRIWQERQKLTLKLNLFMSQF